ncbi:MAG: arabinose isomerase, partial [Opitutales bacterium]|nr:arabinose isomerase [Opitutales bacterium]
MATSPLRVGLFGIGLDAYWPQFAGLKERLEGYVARVAGRLARPGVEVVNLGLIDQPERAYAAGHEFRQADVDLIFLHVTTYALSSTVLPVVRRAKVPVIILNLQPAPAIDYAAFNRLGDRTRMTGEWLAHCGACPVPEIANVFQRAGVRFHQVTGQLDDDPPCWREIEGWLEAARVVAGLEGNRLGLMGHYYGGMLDIASDTTLQFHDVFDVQADCPEDALAEAARTSVALDQLVAQRRLGSLAYYYSGTGVPENEATLASIILGTSLLTGRGIPVAGEYEVKNAQAMKILDLLGVGGSFTEYYAMDYRDDVVLMGHDGPGHIRMAEGKPKVRPLQVYHGKVGRGVSIEMSVRHGPVTLLSVIEHGPGQLALLCAEAESVPGPILEIG